MVCISLPKFFLPTVRKNCSRDREKLLKFEAEGLEFAKFLRSLEQFIRTVKGQNSVWYLTECFINLFLFCFLRYNKLEQLEFKLEKIIGIQKHAGKVRKFILFSFFSGNRCCL